MKPHPIAVTTVCSECGLGWELHGEKPTTADCIRLLKIELAKRPTTTMQPYIIPQPYPVYPQYPYYYRYTVGGQSGTTAGQWSQSQNINCATMTPAISNTSCTSVAD